MRFIPNDPHTQQEMLKTIGVSSVDALFECVPESARLKRALNIPEGMAEEEQLTQFREWGKKNQASGMLTFLGAGAYSHFTPLVIDTLLQRSEFFTSYTPYQPEVSQGTLQAIFEFQTFITLLTGMEVANASMYDGASACAEALLMAERIQKNKRKAILAKSLHPFYADTAKSYTCNLGLTLDEVGFDTKSAHIDLGALEGLLKQSPASCVIVQQPNFYGVIEDLDAIAKVTHQAGALLVVVVNEPYSLATLKSPGAQGADLVVGEAQSFGIGLQFGGPYLGFLAARNKQKRQMPGRIAGRAVDAQGHPGFVLTMSTREQHIRRERATSNICSNQNLVMLGALIHLSLMGKEGLKQTALHNVSAFQYFLQQMAQKAPMCPRAFSGPVFNEACFILPKPAQEAMDACIAQKIVPGVSLARWGSQYAKHLLVSVTETKTASQIDQLVAALAKACG